MGSTVRLGWQRGGVPSSILGLGHWPQRGKGLENSTQERQRLWQPEACVRVPGEAFSAHQGGKQAPRPVRIVASWQKRPQAVRAEWGDHTVHFRFAKGAPKEELG